MKLAWTNFSGIRPRVDSRLLPDGSAQIADNVNTERGGLRPLEGVRDIMGLAKNNVQTIYRFGQSLDSETQYWFHWNKDVDVIKGPIADDTSERTFWTGDGAPKYTTAQLGLEGENLPSGWRALGVAGPTTAPILTPTGDFDELDGSENRVYVYTFVSDHGEESIPSDPASVVIRDGQHVRLSAMETAAPNAAVVTHKRIYRAQRGVYLLVAEIPVAEATYTDDKSSDSLGEACPSMGWDMPPATMFSLTAGVGGVCAALDSAEPYSVLFCDPYHLHAWPRAYQQTVDYPTVGVGHFGQAYVVLTTGHPYILTGLHPKNLTMTPAKFYQPCVSKRSIVSTGGDVIWASPDGLVSLGTSGELILTEDLFTPADWRALQPETMQGAWHEGWYVGSYDLGSGPVGFMFHPNTREWIDLPTIRPTAMFRDTVGDALYLAQGNRIVKFRGGSDMAYTWKGNKTTTPLSSFAYARVTCSQYPVQFTLHRDGEEVLSTMVRQDEPFRLPSGLGRSWETTVSGSVPVLGIVLSTTGEDV